MNKKMMNLGISLWLACVAGLMATSCTDEPDDGATLPPGAYPMTFTAAVDGLAATRATTDNTWAGGETVAIQTGNEVKQYTASSGGRLAAASGAVPFYWQSAAETKTVTAWYYGTGYNATPPSGTSWAVQSDQSATDAGNTADNYQRSDFLYAPATSVAFKPSGGVGNGLTFYHQTARVVVNILKAEAATDASAIQSVVIGHTANLALSGRYTAPTSAGAPAGTNATAGTWDTSIGSSPTMGTITTKKLAAPSTLAGGGIALASYAALVIPQQMKDKKFIAVTLANGNTYYYTPTQDDDANLQSGRQHTYNITVKHGYLEVTSATVGSAWGGDGSAEDVTDKTPPNGYAPDDLKIGDYYYSDGTTSDGGYRKYPGGTTAIMPVQPVLKDADGKDRTVIGLVFWLGDATAKDQTLKAAHPGCTHGLVVALKDASETAWQYPYVSVQAWLNSNKSGVFLAVESDINAGDPLNNIQGYNNTKAIEAFNEANSSNKVQAVETVAAYRTQVKAPGNSSDWYLPSEKELTLLCGREVSDIWTNDSGGTANRDLINTKIESISGAVKISSAHYWSSTEYDSDRAFRVYFDDGRVNFNLKYYTYRVRCALAF